MHDFARTFAGKRVFVTGHTGFKGAWLALWLQHLGAEVTGYSLAPPTEPNFFTVSNVADQLAGHHQANLLERERLQAAIAAACPDLVMHLAAQSVVRTGYAEPYDTFATNVMGTVSLLEAIRLGKHSCAVLCVTSDKCYENREQVWGYRENDTLGDHDPYGASKGAAEVAIRAYRDSFFPPGRLDQHGVALASARAGNVIGGGDWKAYALLPDAFRALARGETMAVRNPNATRPWQHVLQCLSGYLTIAAKLLGDDPADACSGWNIGPTTGSELPVCEVLDHFLEAWEGGAWAHVGEENAPREATILRLCIDKAVWQLGWSPAWTVYDAIRETARWYRRYLEDPERMREFSLQQIVAYTEAMQTRVPQIVPR
jgi:CDP-glucose 4,6-dehydratase